MSSLKSSLNVWCFLLLLRILTVRTELFLKEPPCNYRETVSLEEASKFEDGSYLWDNILVPRNETWAYNYRMLVRDVIIDELQHPHVRGCICQFGACINICCPHGAEYEAKSNECKIPAYDADPHMNITIEGGNTFSADISAQFINQYGRPCRKLMCLKDNYNFTLFEDGSIYAYNDYETSIYSKDEYCLSPLMVDRSSYFYYPWVCSKDNNSIAEELFRNGIVMISSVPFMLITILVYLLSGKPNTMVILICFYLLALSLAFTTFSCITLMRNIEQTICTILGYTTYFAFIASYSWLAVISYDLLYIDQNRTVKIKTLMIYSLFGWGVPTFLLGFALFAQNQDWDDFYKPNIGGKIYCFFDDKKYNRLIYFYGPSIVLISFNVFMFIFLLTVKKIGLKEQTNVLQATSKLTKNLETCGVYARIFLITGVAWVFEILEYCFPDKPVFEALFYLVEFQGYFLFLSAISTEKIRSGLKKRYDELFHRQRRHDAHEMRNVF